MAFHKINKPQRNTVSFPALHVGKTGLAFLNSIFTKVAKIKATNDNDEPATIRFDCYFDSDTNRFAIKFDKDGMLLKQVNKQKQIHFYVKTIFKEERISLTKASGIYEMIFDSKENMWICQLPKDLHYSSNDEAAEEVIKKIKKKKKHRSIEE